MGELGLALGGRGGGDIFNICSNFYFMGARPLGPLGPWSKAPGAHGTHIKYISNTYFNNFEKHIC